MEMQAAAYLLTAVLAAAFFEDGGRTSHLGLGGQIAFRPPKCQHDNVHQEEAEIPAPSSASMMALTFALISTQNS